MHCAAVNLNKAGFYRPCQFTSRYRAISFG